MMRFPDHRRPPKRASRWPGTLLAFMPMVLPACAGWPALRAHPALITHATAASRADLERAVSQAFGGAPVRLADDALTRDSLLIVGRAQARDARGLPLNGRDLERGQHFRLLRRGSHCVLLHVETGKSSVLAHTECRVLPSGHSRD
ncbi:MAG TPA: hypothetical protein VFA39_14265 [Steroidobacteraceae bacterium]|nr:hypothetical protein [Steroidobacteraceae bacterium]